MGNVSAYVLSQHMVLPKSLSAGTFGSEAGGQALPWTPRWGFPSSPKPTAYPLPIRSFHLPGLCHLQPPRKCQDLDKYEGKRSKAPGRAWVCAQPPQVNFWGQLTPGQEVMDSPMGTLIAYHLLQHGQLSLCHQDEASTVHHFQLSPL